MDERRIAAVIAAACADAAAQPLHWVYKPPVLDEAIKGKEVIEFHEPAVNPFYRIPTGHNTCYGDQAFVTLESLVEKNGFDKEDMVKRMYAKFGPDSDYDHSKRVDQYKSQDLKEKTKWNNMPVSGPWRNGSIKNFLQNVENGCAETGCARDQQIDGVARVAPVTALYAGREDLVEKVEQTTSVLQKEDLTVAITVLAARILEQFIIHGKSKSPVQVVEEMMRMLSDSSRPDHDELDTYLASILRKVLDVKDRNHKDVCFNIFKRD